MDAGEFMLSTVVGLVVWCAIIEYINKKNEEKADRFRQSIWAKLDIRAEKNSGEYTNRMHISNNEVIHTLNGS